MRRKALLATAVVVIAAATGLTAILSASASTAPAPPSYPFASVVMPSGPLLPLERVEQIALGVSTRAGEPSPAMSVGSGTLEDAMRSIDRSTTIPEPSPGLRAMLAEPVVLVVMRGQFTLKDAHVRKGDAAPSGNVLDLIVDARTGAVVGRALPIQQPTGGLPVEPVASVANAGTGTLAGQVTLSGGPRPRTGAAGPRSAIGYKVLIARRGRLVAIATTSQRGYRVDLRPGTYEITGHVGICARKTATVRRARTTRVNLACSIR